MGSRVSPCDSRISNSAAIGVVDLETHQEPVELRFGQGIGAFVLDRVLRGDHHEGRRQLVRDAVDVTCRSAIASRRADWVFGDARLISSASNTLLNTGPAELEGVGSSVPDAYSGDVGREEIGGELHATEAAVDAASQCFAQAGLADTRDVLDQTWPSAIRANAMRWITVLLPLITVAMLAVSEEKSAAKFVLAPYEPSVSGSPAG